jgi:uncharacterized RDD family membrane protein YckC
MKMGFKENLKKQYLDENGKKRGFWSWLWNNPLMGLILVLSLLAGFIGLIPALLGLYLIYTIFKIVAFSKDKNKK